jgi:hypothetical protein
MVSTTHDQANLWHYQDHLDHHVMLRVADDHAHSPVGMGYLKIPVIGPQGSIMFPMQLGDPLDTVVTTRSAISTARIVDFDCSIVSTRPKTRSYRSR